MRTIHFLFSKFRNKWEQFSFFRDEDNSSNSDTYEQTIKRLQKEKEELLAKKEKKTNHPTGVIWDLFWDFIWVLVASIILVLVLHQSSL